MMEPPQFADEPSLPGGPPGLEPRTSFLKRVQPVTFAVIALFVVFFLYQFVAGGLTLILFKGKITDDNVDFVRWSTLAGQALCILLPTILLVRARHQNLAGYFRFHIPDPAQMILTVVSVFALQQMLQGYMAVQDAIPLPPMVKEIVDTVKKLFEETYRILVSARSPGEFVMVIFSVALIPAFAEELLFRGLVQRSMEQAAGGLRGAVITGLIFGAYHLNPFSFVPLAALGIYFGFIVHRSQNISLAISAHFFNNFIACVAVYLKLSDDFVAVAPAGNPTTGMMVMNFALFTLVFVGATSYFVVLTKQSDTA